MRSARVNSGQNRLLKAVLQAILAGAGALLLLLAAGAAIFLAFPLPDTAIRPAACLILGVSTAVSGMILATRVGRQRLLCGLGSGVFFSLCLVLASAATGSFVLNQNCIALICVSVCCGMFGGAATALRPSPYGN